MPVIIIILLAFVFMLFRKKQAFKEPVILLNNIKFDKLTAKEITGRLSLTIQNNNTDDIVIDYVMIDLLKGEYRLGTIEGKKPVKIAGRTEKEIVLPFTIKTDISLVALLKSKSKEKLDGYVKGYYGNIPFKIPVNETI